MQKAEIKAASATFTDAASAGDWARAERILLDTLGACDTGADVGAVLTAGGIDEAVFDEGGPTPAVADALVARAVAMAPKDGAATLSWLVSLATVAPASLLFRRPERSAFEEAMDRHVGLFRTWLADRAQPRRLTAAHLLAWCDSATAADARGLLDLARSEGASPLGATALLSAAALSSRLDDAERGALVALAAEIAEGEAALPAAVAAAVLVSLGETLGTSATLALVLPLTAKVALPAGWGWRPRGTALDGAALSAAMLPRLRTHDPTAALDALDAVEFDLTGLAAQVRSRALRAAVATTAFRLAFDARGRSVPRVGLAAEELDPPQRRALELAVRLQVGVPELCLHPPYDDVAEVSHFLAGDDLHFRPIEVPVGGRTHRWHFARILGAVAWQEVDEGAALDATSALPVAEAADLASRWSSGRVWLDEAVKDPAARGRILSFCLALLERLAARGLDVDALAVAALDDRSKSSPDHAILALAVLRAHHGEVPDALIPAVARAAETGWWHDAVLSAVSALPAPTRRRVLDAMRPSAYTLPFLALDLDAATVRRIALTRWWDAPGPALAVLAQGGPQVAEALRAIAYPNDIVRSWAVPFVDAALAAAGRGRDPIG